jgi:citrate lyase subunit beta/citryl-CoA lyase
MTLLRSLLFVPGNRPKMLQKALGLVPDAYMPDMEDAVPAGEKESARSVTASFLPGLGAAGPLVIPRVNHVGSGLLEDDLAAVVGPHIYGVSVGKTDAADQVRQISDLLGALEKQAGLEVGRTRLVPWIESALAVVNAYEICAASPRVVAVAFGAEDFTNDMGIVRTGDDVEIEYPRSVVCVAAKAAGVLALDTPYFSLRDPEGLRRDAQAARGYGFRGKFAIHPDQIDVINGAFDPSAEEIEDARRIVAASEQAERSGRGATSLDGEVIDAPVVKRARNLLGLAGMVLGRPPVGE